MDLCKIHRMGEAAAAAGQDIDEAVKTACDLYEIKGS